MKAIRKAAVLGAGTMGSGIAAHLANAGVPCLLLDIVPPDLSEKKKADPAARSRLATDAIARQLKKEGGFFDVSNASLVEAGNIEDDLDRLRDCDWIIEAVPERVEIKHDIYRKIAGVRRSDAIVSSNTSGISLDILSQEMDESFRQHFLITHFFNPPRYLYLLEIVPGSDTLPEVLDSVENFADVFLGKGVVRCKDTPNFIGNRVGVYAIANCAHLTEELGLTFEQVDAITGPSMGRPRTASYKLLDLVGIDVIVSVMENVPGLLPDDESRDLFKPTALLKRLVEEGRLGRKSGAGFYKKEGRDILVLDPETFEYRARQEVAFESLAALRGEKGLGNKIKKLVSGDDAAAEFSWKHLSGVLCYSARRIPEISDDLVSIDQALRWGFAWEQGPFELWDGLGVRESVDRMDREGMDVPANVIDMLEKGREKFYDFADNKRTFFDFATSKAKPEPARAGVLFLDDVRRSSKPLVGNKAASVWDIGDGVLCVEFHSKMNTISSDTLDVIQRAVDVAEKDDYAGIVVGNQAPHFSAGADLSMLVGAARQRKWKDIEDMIRGFHGAALRMRYSLKPVVNATQGLALGGGCEMSLAGHHWQAAAETYTGLVELGVGLIPAGGGSRELACRAHEAVPSSVHASLFPYVRRAFETVAQAARSTSAEHARSLGFLRPGDGISANRDRVIADAKRTAIHMAEQGFRPPPTRDAVRVVGKPGFAELQVIAHQFREAGYISEYDAYLALCLGRILCGGEIDDDQTVTEQYLLDMEREIFLELCGQEKTLERIEHILKTGKPLRN
jgi:3-hydroxyacyl-CoA dehydrogenase